MSKAAERCICKRFSAKTAPPLFVSLCSACSSFRQPARLLLLKFKELYGYSYFVQFICLSIKVRSLVSEGRRQPPFRLYHRQATVNLPFVNLQQYRHTLHLFKTSDRKTVMCEFVTICLTLNLYQDKRP